MWSTKKYYFPLADYSHYKLFENMNNFKHIFVYFCKCIQVVENFSKVSLDQLAKMLCFIESHSKMARNCHQSSSQGRLNLSRLWNDIATKLNSLCVIWRNAAQLTLLAIYCRLDDMPNIAPKKRK